MTFSSAQEELNIILGDSANTTFSIEEKTRALTRAWNDQYVVKVVWNNDLTFNQSVYQYALPAGISVLADIYIPVGGNLQPSPEPISNDAWEVVDESIHFNHLARSIVPTGTNLYLKGRKKLSTNDTLDSVSLQEYVLSLAGVNTLTLLTHKKANLFVKNDTTMSELIGLRRELMNDVREGRLRLQKSYESA